MALEKEFHASPPRCTRPGPSILKQQRSPASRRLFIEDSIVQDEEAAKPPIKKELLKGDTACDGGDSDKENMTGDGMLYLLVRCAMCNGSLLTLLLLTHILLSCALPTLDFLSWNVKWFFFLWTIVNNYFYGIFCACPSGYKYIVKSSKLNAHMTCPNILVLLLFIGRLLYFDLSS